MMKKSSRRKFIKNASLAGAVTIAAPFVACNENETPKKVNTSPSVPQSKGAIIGHGDFKYRVDKNWGVQNEAAVPVKDCHEMVQDSKGRLILLTNHTKNNIIIYDRSGKVLKTWTLDLPGAHGLTLAQEGSEEFLFITDTDINKVYKTSLDGQVLLEMGPPKAIEAYADASKYKPTEIAVAPNGDFYVADGYGENYITQYSPKGEYIRHFGGKGSGDGQFDCCHGVTLDTRDAANPTLLITSRSKQEFKRFSLDGNHLSTIHVPGCWICRPVIKGENLYFAVIVTKSWGSYDGMIAVLDKNNVVVSFPGGSAPVYTDGILQNPDYDGFTFLNPHDVCIDNDENIYVPQWYSGKTYPVKLERV